MTASAWNPNSAIVTQANAQGLIKQELKIATEGQRIFAVDSFAFAVGTGSVQVYKNGGALARNIDFAELSGNEVILMEPTVAKDKILIEGRVGIEGNVVVDQILRNDLASPGGSNLVQAMLPDAGAIARPINDWLKEGHLSVKNFGAKGDGVKDDTADIQDAINAVSLRGGGQVFFPPGTYIITDTLLIKSYVELIGCGGAATVIRQTTLAADAIRGDTTNQLIGTSDTGGVRRAAIIGITVEGTYGANAPNGTDAQNGIRIYGYGNFFYDIHTRKFGGVGLLTHWRTPGVAPDSGYDDGFVENHYMHVKSYLNGLSGIKVDGPHDGQWNDIICYSNNMKDASADKPNFWITSKSSPQYINQIHCWGNTSGVAFLAESPVRLNNFAFEGATQAQFRIKAGEIIALGGDIFAAGSNAAKGIEFVGGDAVCIGFNIDAVIRDCNGGSIDYGTGVQSIKIQVRLYQTAGTPVIGTHPKTTSDNSWSYNMGGLGAGNLKANMSHFQGTFANISLTNNLNQGFINEQHGGVGMFAFPQRTTEPAANYNPPSGFVGCGRENAIKLWQTGGFVGALMGQQNVTIAAAATVDFTNYAMVALSAAGADVTINNFSGGLIGSLIFLKMPSGGAEITISTAGNIKSKTGAALTRTGLGSNRMLSFVRDLDGFYYQT